MTSSDQDFSPSETWQEPRTTCDFSFLVQPATRILNEQRNARSAPRHPWQTFLQPTLILYFYAAPRTFFAMLVAMCVIFMKREIGESQLFGNRSCSEEELSYKVCLYQRWVLFSHWPPLLWETPAGRVLCEPLLLAACHFFILLMLSSQEAPSMLWTVSSLAKNIENNKMKTHNVASLKTVFCIITSVLIILKRLITIITVYMLLQFFLSDPFWKIMLITVLVFN